MNAPWTGLMEDPVRFVVWVYTWITERPIPDAEVERVIQEFWYPGVSRAVPRYFNSSSFSPRVVGPFATDCSKLGDGPVLIMQGYGSKNPTPGNSMKTPGNTFQMPPTSR